MSRVQPADTVNIGRDTPFGSPIYMHRACPVCFQTHRKPGDTLHCYEEYLRDRFSINQRKRYWAEEKARKALSAPMPKDFYTEVMALDGKTLFCPGCGVGSPTCHGRVLEKFIAEEK